jgi:hypothetical protein
VAAVGLTIVGWLLVSTGVSVWLWPLAILALVASCLLARSWSSIALRLSVFGVVLLAFPVVVNAVVYALDAAGIVEIERGGTEAAGHR